MAETADKWQIREAAALVDQESITQDEALRRVLGGRPRKPVERKTPEADKGPA